MSVREVKNGRFIGLRAQRTIAGKLQVRTWSYRMPVRVRGSGTGWRDATEEEKSKMLVAATAYDQKLAEQQALEPRRPYDPFKMTVRNNTGIRGLNFRMRKEYSKSVPALFVTLTDDEGQLHNRYHQVDEKNWNQVWEQSVREIAVLKKLDEVLVQRMLARKPDYKKLMAQLEAKSDVAQEIKAKRKPR